MEIKKRIIITLFLPLLLFAQQNTPDTLRILSGNGGAGASIALPLELYNQDSVAGIEFSITFSEVNLDSITTTSRTHNMSVSYNIWDDSAKVVIVSLQGNSILPGRGSIGNLYFTIPDTFPSGDSISINFSNVVLSDPNAGHLPVIGVGGWIRISPSDTLMLLSNFGAPGGHVRIPVRLINSVPISAIQAVLHLDANKLHFENVTIDSEFASSFNISVNYLQDSLRLVMISFSGDSIIPGTHELFYIDFTVDTNSTLGDSTFVSLDNVVLSDPHANHVSVIGIGGWVYVRGMKGDLNQDNAVDITDAVREVNIILGRPPAPTPYEEWAGDMNNDGVIDVTDAVAIVNVILGRGKGESEGGIAEMWIEDGKLIVRSRSPIAGVQFELTGNVIHLIRGRDLGNMQMYTEMTPNGYKVVIIGLDGSYLLPGHQYAIAEFTGDAEIRNPIVSDKLANKIIVNNLKIHEIKLYRIIPNPVTGVIGHAKFALPQKFDVSLKIYDTTGRLIQEIAKGTYNRGFHEISFKTDKLKSGVYFLRLSAGKCSQIQKFIVK